MAISRILSQHFARKVLGMIIHLSRPAVAERKPGEFSFAVVRRYPRINPETFRGGSGRLPFLCFVLHRMGFFVPHELLRER